MEKLDRRPGAKVVKTWIDESFDLNAFEIMKHLYAKPDILYVNAHTYKGLMEWAEEAELDDAKKTTIGKLLYA